MKNILAFIRGMQEFRLAFTTRYTWPTSRWYERGREFAHRVTLRRYDV